MSRQRRENKKKVRDIGWTRGGLSMIADNRMSARILSRVEHVTEKKLAGT